MQAGIPVWMYFAGSNWTGGTFTPTFNASYAAYLPTGYLPHAAELQYAFTDFSVAADSDPHFHTDPSAQSSMDLGLLEFSRAIDSEALRTSWHNYYGTFAKSTLPSDPSSGAVWPRANLDENVVEYMYMSPAGPDWRGGPGGMLEYPSEDTCDFWSRNQAPNTWYPDTATQA